MTYQDSGKSYAVQGADLLAGTIRRTVLNNIDDKTNINDKLKKFIDFRLYLP